MNPTFRRLLSLAKLELKLLLWGLFFLVISSVAGLVYPQAVRWLVDNVLTPKRYDLLTPVSLGLFGVFVLQSLAGSTRYYLFTLSGEKIVLRLRQMLFDKILAQDVSFFDFHRTGQLMSHLASDCTTLQNTVSVNISQGLRNLGQVIGGLGFMFYTSWKLSLIMLVLIPPTGLAAAYFGKRIRKSSKEFQEAISLASIVAEEAISGVRTVKSFIQEPRESARYGVSLSEALKQAKFKVQGITEFMTLAMIVGFGAICFVLWFGGREVILDHLTVGDLTQFLLYLMLVAIGVGSLGSLWGDLLAGVGASQRVFEILERPDAEVISKNTKSFKPQGKIEFRNVNFYYPTRTDYQVLTNMNFKIEPGQIVAFVGASGGGKSTVASLISRFYEPTSGEIIVDDVLIKNIDLGSLRSQIGIVSQEPILISSTIEENIRYSQQTATDEEVFAAARAANALEFIQSFPDGFKTRVGEKGIQLSGGQKQRVAIARALLKDPRILILDEATSNLDTASEALVQEAMQRLMKDRTTIVIAHRLTTIQEADVIHVVDGGKIVQTGTHKELSQIKDGIYFHLLSRQLK